MKIEKLKEFPVIVGISAAAIALCAAFFSVYGIGGLFAGAALSTMIMASSLEIGKLVATTFLYRYWKKSNLMIRMYLSAAIVVLMVITSAGIFGFLSSAYQKSALEHRLLTDQIAQVESSKSEYTKRIESHDKRIQILNDVRKTQENRLSEMATNIFLTRNPIQLQQLQQQTIGLIDQSNSDIKSESDTILKIRDDIRLVDEKINQMKLGGINKKDIQTFKFLADSLNVSLDTVVKWFIVLLICVFDPLAIALILAYNISIEKSPNEDVVNAVSEPVVNTEPTIVDNAAEQTDLQSTDSPIEPSTTEPTPTPTSAAVPGDDFFRRFFKQ